MENFSFHAYQLEKAFMRLSIMAEAIEESLYRVALIDGDSQHRFFKMKNAVLWIAKRKKIITCSKYDRVECLHGMTQNAKIENCMDKHR